MLLLGDGAVTRHLQLMTGEEIAVDIIAMEDMGEEDGAPEQVSALAYPRIRRQVWLRTASGQCLVYATSWWNSQSVDQYLKDRSLPIWKSLAQTRTEHFRDLKGLYWGDQASLAMAFGTDDPLWGRHYLLWHQGQPITLIYEVFSPCLNQYLGNPG